MGDYSGGKADLAAAEFNDFIRFYPNDPNAATAQFYIAQIHYSQGRYDQAVMDFDAVLERYPREDDARRLLYERHGTEKFRPSGRGRGRVPGAGEEVPDFRPVGAG